MKLRFALLLMQILSVCVAQGASVDLAVSIAAPTGPISVSSNLVYTITVTNAGSVRATAVIASNELAGNLTFVSVTTSQGSCSHSAGILSCNLGNVDARAAVTISVRTHPSAQGWSDTRADVWANQDDYAPENNTAWAQTIVGLTDLALRSDDVPESLVAGGTITFVFTVTNRGPDATPGQSGVALSLPIGSDYNMIISTNMSAGTFDSWTGNASWVFPTLAVGDSETLTLEIWVVSHSDLWYSAQTTAGVHDTNSSNNSVGGLVKVTPGRGILQFAQTSQDAVESSGSAQIRINRIGGAIGSVQVGFATEDGTATAEDDYATVNNVVTFAPGETTKVVPVSLFKHPQFECARDFKGRLFSPADGAILGPKTNTTITLFDDDVLPRGTTECISVTYSNSLWASRGDPKWLSEDGRYILFLSADYNWLTNNASGVGQIFLRDTVSGTTRLVTSNHQNSGGSTGNPDEAMMSADGRYVAFTSNADDLTTNAATGARQVFIRDLVAEKTRLVSVSVDGGTGGSENSRMPMTSSNGRMIAFGSRATNLVANCQCEGYEHIFARDLTTGITRLVSEGLIGPANSHSYLADFTPDGRFVLFWSDATNLVTGDFNGATDLFVRDLESEVTWLVTMNAAGTGSGNGDSYPQAWPRITPNGRFVVFDSDASDFVPGDTNGLRDVFIRDLLLATTRLVSVDQEGARPSDGYSYGTSVTPDGRYVAFLSDATNIVAGIYDGQGYGRFVFVRDMLSNTTMLASAACDGKPTKWSAVANISANGRYVTFMSYARDLVPGAFPISSGGSRVAQIFRRDLLSEATALISANYEYTGAGCADSGEPFFISADGKSIVFANNAADLTAARDENGGTDVFLWRELPAGPNAEVRVTSTVSMRLSVMVITLAVTNFGPETATGVGIQNAVSGGASFIAADTTLGSCTLSAGVVACSLGNLARRAGAVITLIATPTASGVASHTATVSQGVNDPLPGNNSLSAFGTLTLPPSATLWISRSKPRTFVQWLSAPPEFQLEIGLLNGWSPMSSGILDNGVLKTLIVNDGAPPAQFYRLRRP